VSYSSGTNQALIFQLYAYESDAATTQQLSLTRA
jgi:hypothetical protein